MYNGILLTCKICRKATSSKQENENNIKNQWTTEKLVEASRKFNIDITPKV